MLGFVREEASRGCRKEGGTHVGEGRGTLQPQREPLLHSPQGEVLAAWSGLRASGLLPAAGLVTSGNDKTLWVGVSQINGEVGEGVSGRWRSRSRGLRASPASHCLATVQASITAGQQTGPRDRLKCGCSLGTWLGGLLEKLKCFCICSQVLRAAV